MLQKIERLKALLAEADTITAELESSGEWMKNMNNVRAFVPCMDRALSIYKNVAAIGNHFRVQNTVERGGRF
jgi:hypothetical protein